MQKLISVLSQKILDHIVPNQTNIVRIEGIDNPVVYSGVCKTLKTKSNRLDTFVPKITYEKYTMFEKEKNESWDQSLAYLYQGDNSFYARNIDTDYKEKSYVDFDNAMTKWRNESANISGSETALILLMGTEAAKDEGGLSDTSFVISPSELLSELTKDYSSWFDDVIKKNDLGDSCRKVIHTLYRTLFSEISTDIFKLSTFIDSLEALDFSSSQDLVNYICETLSDVWEVPSICDVKKVPKVSALKKGSMKSAQIIVDAIHFINRSDDIPTQAEQNRLRHKFKLYAEKHNITVTEPFPDDQSFSSYSEFENTVLEFKRGINLDENRKKLLRVDYAIIDSIIGTKISSEPKEKVQSFSGSPIEFYAKMLLNAIYNFKEDSSINPNPIRIKIIVDRIFLSDCTKDQKDASYRNICNFTGGILNVLNNIFEVNEGLLSFEYEEVECDDPFVYNNYKYIEKRVKLSGKWGDPSKIHFIIKVSNEQESYKYEYTWVISPYSPWLNAFSYLTDVLYSRDDCYVLPTMVCCEDLNEYLDCESEDEFYAQLQKFKGEVVYDEHRAEIIKYFNDDEAVEWFDLICDEFRNFAIKLSTEGFFNSGNELRDLVDKYKKMLTNLENKYKGYTDIQKEKLPLLVNCFMIANNKEKVMSGEMTQVIVPAYNPIMLEKIDAQQLFLRDGFEEILRDQIRGARKRDINNKLETLVQLASITQAADVIYSKNGDYLSCNNMWDYYGVYFKINDENKMVPTNAVDLSIFVDEESSNVMLQNTPTSKIIIRNVMDYVHTFPARTDGLNIAFVGPTDMQHIVSAIHSIAKELEDNGTTATINAKFICINSKKNSATYLRRWLDSYFDDSRSVKVNTYLYNMSIQNKAEVNGLEELLENEDLCFTYNILQPTDISFDRTNEQPLDINYEKFPMTFTPDTISSSQGKVRKLNISQPQFEVAKEHTQLSYKIGNPNSYDGTYRAYKKLELLEIQKAIIDIAHCYGKWVVCIDQVIDRKMLESSDKESNKIIGFTTGEGSYGELNVTVSARNDILSDIKQLLRDRFKEEFPSWDKNRLKDAADFCVDELSQYMDGSRILKALNPYDYEVHNFLAYALTVQILGLTKNEDNYVTRSLISLDSYSHWFDESYLQNDDNKRPDFMLIEIPKTVENISDTGVLDLRIKIIECKMAYKKETHINKAQEQLRKGLRTMIKNWRPKSNDVMHRYWLNQLYRAIIFAPLNLEDNSKEYINVRKKIYEILNGNFKIEWTGDIYAFWLDDDNEISDEFEILPSLSEEIDEEGVSLGRMIFHNYGQLFIQKMLLPEKERSKDFMYDEPTLRENEEIDETEDLDGDILINTTIEAASSTIPTVKETYEPFLEHLGAQPNHSRQESLLWFKSFFNISKQDCEILYSNGHSKWETTLDSVITDFRKLELLENDQLGEFHITNLGRNVLKKLKANQRDKNFNEIVNETREQIFDSNAKENEDTNRGQSTSISLKDVRVLIGKDRRGNQVFWEFGNEKLANRHILITGTSGQGKTYAIQTMILELARQNISSVVFDYTDGFLPGKLEPEFEKELEGKIKQEIAYVSRIPVNPFRSQMIELPSYGSVPEPSSAVAGRLSDILKHVYSFGDQQSACIYTACKQGIDQYGDNMDFGKLRGLLEEIGTPQSKSVLSKMAQFFDMDLFDSSREFNWKEVTQGGGKVTVIQLTGLDRELQTIVTEIMLWDAWYSLAKFGDKNTPFVVVLDEAQNLSFKEKSPAEKILREGRKYGWSAWFATQFLKGAMNSGEISNLQQAAVRLYFKPTGEEMNYIADQIAESKSESMEWLNTIKGLQKGQCILQGDRIKPNGQFGAARPTLVSVSSFEERINHERE